jgi:8-oxo-(d)GTP phosphatase
MSTQPLAPLRAAGAVAHQRDRKRTRILLVHRPKYGDWSLPKGHLDEGESYEDAAVRELEEEAGVTGEIGALVGTIGYRVRRRPKAVRYWLVEAESTRFRPNSEVDEVAWVSPKAAMRLSSYDDDRSVIATAVSRLSEPRSARIRLLRHTEAGTRANWAGDDELRPLSALGRRRARAVNNHLVQTTLTHILTSPYRRCEETVTALGRALDLPVEIGKPLTEEQPPERTIDLLAEMEGTSAVLCSHGDIISGVIRLLVDQGVDLDGPLEWKKGSIWDLELLEGRVKTGTYLPPPAV